MTVSKHRKCPDCNAWMDVSWDAINDLDNLLCSRCGLCLVISPSNGQIIKKFRTGAPHGFPREAT